MGVVGRRRLAERLLCVPRLRTLDARVPAPLDALYWAALGLEERRGKLERVAPIAPVADFRDAFARACPN